MSDNLNPGHISTTRSHGSLGAVAAVQSCVNNGPVALVAQWLCMVGALYIASDVSGLDGKVHQSKLALAPDKYNAVAGCRCVDWLKHESIRRQSAGISVRAHQKARTGIGPLDHDLQFTCMHACHNSMHVYYQCRDDTLFGRAERSLITFRCSCLCIEHRYQRKASERPNVSNCLRGPWRRPGVAVP